MLIYAGITTAIRADGSVYVVVKFRSEASGNLVLRYIVYGSPFEAMTDPIDITIA
jgi:hypothetical protein